MSLEVQIPYRYFYLLTKKASLDKLKRFINNFTNIKNEHLPFPIRKAILYKNLVNSRTSKHCTTKTTKLLRFVYYIELLELIIVFGIELCFLFTTN